MREPEDAAGRPPAPQETATNSAIGEIGTSLSHVVAVADIRDRRRVSRELDDVLGIIRPVNDASDVDADWYAVTGLNLGVAERERAGVAR